MYRTIDYLYFLIFCNCLRWPESGVFAWSHKYPPMRTAADINANTRGHAFRPPWVWTIGRQHFALPFIAGLSIFSVYLFSVLPQGPAPLFFPLPTLQSRSYIPQTYMLGPQQPGRNHTICKTLLEMNTNSSQVRLNPSSCFSWTAVLVESSGLRFWTLNYLARYLTA